MIFLTVVTVYGRYNIDSHDYTVRLKAAQRFLKDGDKVALLYPSDLCVLRLISILRFLRQLLRLGPFQISAG